MMLQWDECKKQAKDDLLLFRLGDFYESFEEDALILSKELGIVLTKRQDIPMAGIPAHMCDIYVDRLVDNGFSIAIAEQVEEAKNVKGIVRRAVVRRITPGSVIHSTLLKDKSYNFIVSLAKLNSLYGLAVLDVTTADFRVIEFDTEKELFDELVRLRPNELLLSEKCHRALSPHIGELEITAVRIREEWHFDHRSALDNLLQHFHLHSLDGFGLKGMVAAINAASALITYLKNDLHLNFNHIKTIRPYTLSQYMRIDRAAQHHLELVYPLHDKGKTVLSILDETLTPMGGRLLKEWLLHPLLSVQEIMARQDNVEKFLSNPTHLKKELCDVRDLERLMNRIESGYATPRDLSALHLSLKPIPAISAILEPLGIEKLPEVLPIIEKLEMAIVENPPLRTHEGGIFKVGYHAELDEFKKFKAESCVWLATYQERLREETQIRTLKVGYTQPSGYYIEVSRSQSEKMPPLFKRRQTLVNAERFISLELKEFEHKILTIEEKIITLENQLFIDFRQKLATFAETVLTVARRIAEIDVYLSLATVARDRDYVRPVICNDYSIDIKAGRHPVIENSLKQQTFIPNDLDFNQEERVHLITGPNMAGKSTFIRQVALIVIFAQMGSFVPARKAKIGIVDKLFTRIGASDDLSRGQSTFMVEMSETANILNNVTPHSLVILDEIGRGTSTYDGIAIAGSVIDYLLKKGAKTLFATHYFELTFIAKEGSGAVNYHVTVLETAKEIAFLHKIVRGKTDKSYGIHVATLAGLPASVIKEAQNRLEYLNTNDLKKDAAIPL